MSLLARVRGWFKGESKEVPEAVPKSETLVWGIVDGPYSREDFPPEELAEGNIKDHWNYMVVAKIEEKGELGFANIWYSTFDEAYQIKTYFDSNIEPIVLDFNE